MKHKTFSVIISAPIPILPKVIYMTSYGLLFGNANNKTGGVTIYGLFNSFIVPNVRMAHGGWWEIIRIL